MTASRPRTQRTPELERKVAPKSRQVKIRRRRRRRHCWRQPPKRGASVQCLPFVLARHSREGKLLASINQPVRALRVENRSLA